MTDDRPIGVPFDEATSIPPEALRRFYRTWARMLEVEHPGTRWEVVGPEERERYGLPPLDALADDLERRAKQRASDARRNW